MDRHYVVYRACAVLMLAACTSALTGAQLQAIQAKNDITVTEEGAYYAFASNGIPDHSSGPFPSAHNPNTIEIQNFNFKVPINPSKASTESCLPMGPIGVALNGVPFFSPYTDGGDDATVTETFDTCDGHPDQRGVYHYHQTPDCVASASKADDFVGVAFDGFPIYGPVDASGTTLTSSDLDKCNGRMGADGQYRYHLTREWPYVLGCYYGNLHPEMKNRPGKCDFAFNSAQVTRMHWGFATCVAFVVAVVNSMI